MAEQTASGLIVPDGTLAPPPRVQVRWSKAKTVQMLRFADAMQKARIGYVLMCEQCMEKGRPDPRILLVRAAGKAQKASLACACTNRILEGAR